ncbi:MAG TPA: hypothetical protein DCZ94_22190 [Lentisphaeria bacterium]|nr:MAG: hypothetical protein A2X48_13430 [Lentisphaerae bacterium GWF2_49_21]HBC89658.1 hypothetical protein [Lentisphaeria bacterium]
MKHLTLFVLLLFVYGCADKNQAPSPETEKKSVEQVKTQPPSEAVKVEISAVEKKISPAQVKTDIDMMRPAEKIVIIRNNAETKFASALEAVAAAQTGDVIVLGSGLHRGPLAFKKSGITLKGEPGAYVTAYDAKWKPEWKKEPAYGKYAYSSPIPFDPQNMAIDGRVMINAEEQRHGLDVHEDGIGRNDRTPQQSIFTYISKEKRVLVSFSKEINPADHRIDACGKEPIIKIEGVDNCHVEQLILGGGIEGVQFKNTKGSSVKKCLIFGTDIAAHLSSGATECKVLENDITWNADALSSECDPSTGLVDNDVWNTHKQYGSYDKWGVFAGASGKDNEVAYNYVYDIWDGIEAAGGGDKEGIADYYRNKVFKGISQFNIGLKVHHNRVDLCLDDALEPGGELVNNQWYSNVISRAKCAIRIKTVAFGPFYVYDNLFFKCSDGMRFYKSTPESATVYVYHNIIEYPSAIIYHAMDQVAWNDPELKKLIKPGTPGFHVFNNIFLCEKPFSNSSGIKPNFKGDYNLYTSDKEPVFTEAGIDLHSIFNAKPEFIDMPNGNMLLKEGSQGKKAGTDLSKFSVKLPSCDGKYFKDGLPDIGLLALDKAKTPRGPVSGLWEIAEKNMNLGERDVTNYKLTPIRWVTGGKKIEYVVESLPEKGKEIALKLTTPHATKYKLTATSEDGKLIAERAGSGSKSIEKIRLKIPSEGWKRIFVKIEDSSEGQWRIEPQTEGLKVGINISAPLELNKFDGGRYIFEYDVPAGTQSFKASGDGCEIMRPDGKTEKPGNGGIVNTSGQPGTYKIMLNFIKRSPLTIEGPAKYAFFDSKQETVPLKKRWGRQGF